MDKEEIYETPLKFSKEPQENDDDDEDLNDEICDQDFEELEIWQNESEKSQKK